MTTAKSQLLLLNLPPVSLFTWSPGADTVFKKLKVLLTHALILQHPDPTRQFVVEVDASDSSIGAILSQCNASTRKLYPCSCFSQHLSPAERNYNLGNKELVAIVLALQECSNWLEATLEPFLILTDHKNLVYLHSVKRLNSHLGH